jgi:hypothetical protein
VSSQMLWYELTRRETLAAIFLKKAKAVPLHATEALGDRSIASTYSRPRHYMGVSGQRHAPAVL